MAFLLWEPTHCYPIWQRGGGIYISGGNVAIATSQIFSNIADDVRRAQFRTFGRYVTVHHAVDVTF